MIVRSFNYLGVRYSLEEHRCGRSNCTKCPHGPYWRSYVWVGTRTKGIYLGKNLPAGVPDLGDMRGQRRPARAMNMAEALRILGVTRQKTIEAIERRWQAARKEVGQKTDQARAQQAKLDEAWRVIYDQWKATPGR